ncbi:MAG: hypothetical protein A2Y75_05195 [Candidatus Solincola sediminis]|uniref:thymidylate synthase n=1 Tax=Candidatus Solincola sediminis TaxID=1797199 RepID=A0A1F2WG31_9ACTN|nr:MAG: hypothetical protein A2Y75_05195 [Candidatus Solincola sediminis]
MSIIIRIPSGREGYTHVVQQVMQFGVPRAPRGMRTYDIEDVIVEIASPYDALPLGVGRALSTRIAAVEAIQLIGGFHDPQLMTWASPHFAQFREPSGYFYGAYGARIGTQVHHVVRKLHSDRDSRQAVIVLWNKSLDNTPNKRDYPCTTSLMFSVVRNKLRMRTIMRSNDVWLGFPYDIFQFTQLQCTIAGIMGIEPGSYTHYAASLHIYERDLEHAASLRRPVIDMLDKTVHGISTGGVLPTDLWASCVGGRAIYTSEVTARALQLCYGDLDAPTKSEAWYAGQLSGFKNSEATADVAPNMDERRPDNGKA